MPEHEPSIGATSEWFTPPEYFEAPNLALSRRKQGFESLGSANSNNGLAALMARGAGHQTNTGANIIRMAGCASMARGRLYQRGCLALQVAAARLTLSARRPQQPRLLVATAGRPSGCARATSPVTQYRDPLRPRFVHAARAANTRSCRG